MQARCKTVRCVATTTAVTLWGTCAGVAAEQAITSPHHLEAWANGALILTGAMGATATVVSVLLYALPTLGSMWRDGIEYGREMAALDVPSQREPERPNLRVLS